MKLALQYSITSTPLIYVRSGDTLLSEGALVNAGLNGYVWSRRLPSDSTRVYLFYFTASVVYALNDAYRWHAFPVRCSLA